MPSEQCFEDILPSEIANICLEELAADKLSSLLSVFSQVIYKPINHVFQLDLKWKCNTHGKLYSRKQFSAMKPL